MSIDDLGDLFDVDIDEEEVDTVGGLLAKAHRAGPDPRVARARRRPVAHRARSWPDDATGSPR